MALASRGYKEYFEDWFTDSIGAAAGDGLAWIQSSDTGNTAFAVTATTSGPIARAATDATDDDMCEIAHALLAWSAQNGQVGLEVRCQLDVVTNVAVNVGFNDDALEDSNTLPVELSGTTFTTNSSTWVGAVYDIDATNDDFHVFWVDDDSDSGEAIANLRMTGLAPVAGEWFVVTVVLTDRGSGNGVRADVSVFEESTGKMATKSFNTTVDRDALLTPHIAFENRSGTAHQFDVDYIRLWMSRNTT